MLIKLKVVLENVINKDTLGTYVLLEFAATSYMTHGTIILYDKRCHQHPQSHTHTYNFTSINSTSVVLNAAILNLCCFQDVRSVSQLSQAVSKVFQFRDLVLTLSKIFFVG